MNEKKLKGYFFAILSAVIYGCMPLMSNYIYADGVNPITLVFFRNFFAVIPLGFLAFKESKTLKIDIKLLPEIILTSIFGCFLTPLLLLSSYNYIPSGAATIFHFAYPAIVVIGSIIFLKAKGNIVTFLSVVFCIIGISLFYSPEAKINFTGVVLSFSSALAISVYILLLSRFSKYNIPGLLLSFYVVTIGSVITFIFCLLSNNLTMPSTLFGLILSIIFSLLVTIGAFVLFQQSTLLIGGELASILSTLELVTSVLIGFLVFNEPLTIRLIIGTILVVIASILTTIFDIIRHKKCRA